VANWPEFRPKKLLERLVDRGVDFVVVGGYAAIAHGSARLTRDLDVCFATDEQNLVVLGEVLVTVQARLRGVADDVPFAADAATLRRVRLLTLNTIDGPLDVMVQPDGAPPYAKLRVRSELLDVGGILVRVASVEDMMAMKRASGRPKDVLDLEELEAIARLRRRR
jgi:predicted nucleotidyltransferase